MLIPPAFFVAFWTRGFLCLAVVVQYYGRPCTLVQDRRSLIESNDRLVMRGREREGGERERERDRQRISGCLRLSAALHTVISGRTSTVMSKHIKIPYMSQPTLRSNQAVVVAAENQNKPGLEID